MICSSTRLRLTLVLILNELSVLAFTLPRNTDFRKAGEEATDKNEMLPEPSCEELKAMWRFSKRQSRAAEITNEIPMYRDPFTDNIWQPYFPTSRSIGGMRIGRFRNKPIFGRVVHNPPYLRIQDPSERRKAFEEVVRLYGMPRQQQLEPRRRLTTFRLSGGRHLPALGFPPQQGSFQHLKELIKTERARELQHQRLAEEAAARAAAVKDIPRNENQMTADGVYGTYDYEPEDAESDVPDGDNFMSDEGKESKGTILSFPNLLAPSGRKVSPLAFSRYVGVLPYTRSGARLKTHRISIYDDTPVDVRYLQIGKDLNSKVTCNQFRYLAQLREQ